MERPPLILANDYRWNPLRTWRTNHSSNLL